MEIAVIGGGPAGMIAAGRAAQLGASVTLIEKNSRLGKKLYITGKGRCNVTNNCNSTEFLTNVVRNPKFLYSAVTKFSPQDVIEFFGGLGCTLVTERGRRVFPQSQKSIDIISAMERYLKKGGVKTLLNFAVTGIDFSGGQIVIAGTDGKSVVCDKVILCGGGITYPATGSTGECYGFAKGAGHTVTPLSPALCSIDTKNHSGVPELAGLTLKNVRLTVHYGKKEIYSDIGELLYTHTGLSGPMVLTVSSLISRLDINKVTMGVDLKPGLDINQLDKRIQRDLTEFSNKLLKNSLSELLPKNLIPIIISLSKADGDKPCHSITAKERKDLAAIIKNLSFEPVGLGEVHRAVVTCGGVDVREIDSSTMQSKLDKRLYFAGEIMDIDALTGGYNIQIALSTGYAAGTASAADNN